MSESIRHVVVLGGAGGIGRSIARRFALGGCTVYLLGRTMARLSEAAQAIAAETGMSVVPLVCDLEKPESLAPVFASLPRIDVLVHAAGSIPRKSLHETVPQDWTGPWMGKVLGAVESSRLACNGMRETGGGVIVHVIGIAGIKLNPKTIMTCTANAALIAFTQALGAQSVDWNIRVVGINPGITATPRVQDMVEGKGADAYKALLADMPMGRMGQPDEIADCTWFLASDSARYISGTVIDVDAGARWRV